MTSYNWAQAKERFICYQGVWYSKDNFFEPGDIIIRTSKASTAYSTIQKGQKATVMSVVKGNSNGDQFRDEYDRYQYVYNQNIKIAESSQVYSSSNFVIAQKGTNKVLMIETNRPTFVREFNEIVKDGKTTREYVGEYVPFDNLSAAQTYCSNEISNSIRTTNTYRKFVILQEKAVAQAKKPEIEFA
jgi:hypothetical protein